MNELEREKEKLERDIKQLTTNKVGQVLALGGGENMACCQRSCLDIAANEREGHLHRESPTLPTRRSAHTHTHTHTHTLLL